MVKFREQDIQTLILNKEHIFGDIGKSTIVFEKAIMRGHTICDCLVFTEKRGLIGIEIKTERDTTNRLNKQLHDYELVCDYVYVLCHDTHVEKVETILKRHKHAHVGILAYTEFRGEPLLGEYKAPKKSPRKSAFHMLDILWKTEILQLLGTFHTYGQRVQTATGVKFLPPPQKGKYRSYNDKVYNQRMSKNQLIYSLIKKVGGEQEATRVFCDIFIRKRLHPEKSITYRHFLKVGNRNEQ